MANDLPVQVQSHRTGGSRRRRPVAAIATALVLLAALLTAGFTYYAKRGCSGRDSAVIAASPDIAPLLDDLNASWAKTRPAVGGRCVAVNVEARDSALMATELASPWDAADNGPAPDVWVPQSSVWMQYAMSS
ncbi:MAG TPA: hypothetical protein VH442_05555, partial [Micromonosporaceae bacterium]